MSALPDGLRIYAVGDIHGRADLLVRLLAQIETDRAQHANTQLIFLGDYIDRGLESKRVIDLLLGLGQKPVFLQGNHEQVLRNILRDDDIDIAESWLRFGGREAALSYGVMPPSQITAATLKDFVAKLQEKVPQAHKDFLNGLQFSVTRGDYFFCHAGVRPSIALDAQSEDDLAWIRGDFMHHSAPYTKMVVHGHTISLAPDVKTNRIGIDTGAYATGKLTALGLEGDRQWFLHT